MQEVAGRAAGITATLGLPFVFKASFDKANRSSGSSFRGPGIAAGLKILEGVRNRLGVPVLTDVHEDTPVDEVAAVVDVLQTPAFPLPADQFHPERGPRRQAGEHQEGASSSRPGRWPTWWRRRAATGNAQIMVCERGVSFGYNNLVSDMRALPVLRATGCPVVFDATHSVQQPGAKGSSSGGQREFVPVLARAAVAVGVARHLHGNPSRAGQGAVRRTQCLAAGAHGSAARTAARDRSNRQKTNPSRKTCNESYRRCTGAVKFIDSRGNPTVEAEVRLDSGVVGRAAVPSGASTGSREAVELRDGDKQRYLGKGVLKAVANVNGVPEAGGDRPRPRATQAAIDAKMIALDGTDTKGKLGDNALLAVSLAAAQAAAADAKIPRFRHLATLGTNKTRAPQMPVPMMNIINGGAHADNSLDVQEFMILPVGAPSLAEAVRYGAEIFHTLKKILHDKGLATAVGDEGGFCAEPGLQRGGTGPLIQAVEKAGYKVGQDIYLGLDVASTEFYKDGKYVLEGEGRSSDSAGFADYLAGLVAKYPIITIEDGMSEGDWAGWKLLTEKLGKKVQLVGDDLFVTNTKILQEGIDRHIANSILIKVNQIGTLTETLQAIEMAEAAKYTSIVSPPFRRDRGQTPSPTSRWRRRPRRSRPAR